MIHFYLGRKKKKKKKSIHHIPPLGYVAMLLLDTFDTNLFYNLGVPTYG